MKTEFPGRATEWTLIDIGGDAPVWLAADASHDPPLHIDEPWPMGEWPCVFCDSVCSYCHNEQLIDNDCAELAELLGLVAEDKDDACD